LASSNERGGDAAACFDGMNAALEAIRKPRTPRSRGSVIARAPEASMEGDGPLASVTPPVEALKSDLSVSQRWRVIVEVVLGRGTGAPLQIGVILVGTSSLGVASVYLDSLTIPRTLIENLGSLSGI
jgi:hypothetical protein